MKKSKLAVKIAVLTAALAVVTAALAVVKGCTLHRRRGRTDHE